MGELPTLLQVQLQLSITNERLPLLEKELEPLLELEDAEWMDRIAKLPGYSDSERLFLIYMMYDKTVKQDDQDYQLALDEIRRLSTKNRILENNYNELRADGRSSIMWTAIIALATGLALGLAIGFVI